MGLALPGQAREAIAAGHAVLITTSTGQSLLPANLVADTWQRRFTHDPTRSSPPPGPSGPSSPPPGSCPPSPNRHGPSCASAASPCTPRTGPHWRCPRRSPTHPGSRNPPRSQAERAGPCDRRRRRAAPVGAGMVSTGVRNEAASDRPVGCRRRSQELPRTHAAEPTAKLATWPYPSQGPARY